MASTGLPTPNIGLNQWQGSDKPERVDFNGDNQKTDDAFGSVKQVTNRIYDGVDLTVKFAAEITEFESPWAWIQNRIQSGNFNGINVNDFIPLVVSDNLMIMDVAGINTYTRYGNPDLGNHIDFISRDLWHSPVQWNLVNYNNGLAVMPSPWSVSNMYAFLNSLQMTVPNGIGADPATTTVNYTSSGIYSQLPVELRSIIVQKTVPLPRRYSPGVLLHDNNAGDWRDMGFLWLPSEIEVYGTTQWGGTLSPNQGWDSYGYQQYPIFAESMVKRVKGSGSGGARSGWWLSTPASGYSGTITAVGALGAASNPMASNGVFRFPLCFRIT